MEQIIQSFFNIEIVIAAYPILLRGFGMTVLLCIVVVPLGLFGGLALALLSTVKIRPLKWLVVIYVDFFRRFRRWCC
jgi:polar amino acid transport system permease protein